MRRLYSFITVALLVSLFLYLFYRSEKTIVNQLAIFFLSQNTYASIRFTINQALPLNDSIIYSLPGGLWVFCTTILASDLYLKIQKYQVQITNAPVLFAVLLEACQLLHFRKGTFDLRDVVFYIGFWLFARYAYDSRNDPRDLFAPFSINSIACVASFLSVYLAHVPQ